MVEEPKETKEPVEAPVEKEEKEPTEPVIDNIDRANAAADRMEKANEEREKLISKQEKMIIDAKLAGRADAGQAPVEKTKDEKIIEGARKLLPDGMECQGVTEDAPLSDDAWSKTLNRPMGK